MSSQQGVEKGFAVLLKTHRLLCAGSIKRLSKLKQSWAAFCIGYQKDLP